MKRNWLAVLPAIAPALMLCACAHLDTTGPRLDPDKSSPAGRAIQGVKEKYAPDSHLVIFNVGVQHRGHELILTGDVDRAEARIDVVKAVERTGAKVTDRITVLPAEQLG